MNAALTEESPVWVSISLATELTAFANRRSERCKLQTCLYHTAIHWRALCCWLANQKLPMGRRFKLLLIAFQDFFSWRKREKRCGNTRDPPGPRPTPSPTACLTSTGPLTLWWYVPIGVTVPACNELRAHLNITVVSFCRPHCAYLCFIKLYLHTMITYNTSMVLSTDFMRTYLHLWYLYTYIITLLFQKELRLLLGRLRRG